jgi:hypothetical protein
VTRTIDDVRFFTLEEANRALPYVRRVVADVLAEHAALQTRIPRLRDARIRVRRGGADTELEPLRKEVAEISTRLETFLGELRRVGCVLRGTAGVVDFYGLLDGRPVCFCWRYDEDAVAHWHELDESWEQRRPVDEPALSSAGPDERDG